MILSLSNTADRIRTNSMHSWSGSKTTSTRRQTNDARTAIQPDKSMTFHHHRTCPSSSITRLFKCVHNHVEIRGDGLCLRWEDRLVRAVLFEIRLECLTLKMSARLDTKDLGAQAYVDRFHKLLHIFGDVFSHFARDPDVTAETDHVRCQFAHEVG